MKSPGGFEADLQRIEQVDKKTEEISERVDQQSLFWENLRANAEIQLRKADQPGLRLRGGPMDGWYVKTDAPALAPDWYKTWPPSVAERFEPGPYVPSETGTWAEWKTLE